MSLLSVLIPTYRRPDILPRCLQALRASDLPDGLSLDIVAVDDASGDQTQATLAALAGPDLRVLTHERNRGPAAARNTGIAAARGDFTLIINDDTILAPDAVGHFWRYRAGLSQPAVTVIGNIAPWPQDMTAFEFWASNGGSQFTHARLPPERHVDAGEEEFVTSNMVVETALLRAHPFDESFLYARYEDRELGYRLARAAGHRIHYLPAARSWHCHRLYLRDWLGKWDKFSWAAVHFASLYPEDQTLRGKLSLVRAEQAAEFHLAPLLVDAARLNDAAPRYFQTDGMADPAVRAVADPIFRSLQEFARLTFLRRHLDLPQRRDGAISDVEAVARLTAALKPGV